MKNKQEDNKVIISLSEYNDLLSLKKVFDEFNNVRGNSILLLKDGFWVKSNYSYRVITKDKEIAKYIKNEKNLVEMFETYLSNKEVYEDYSFKENINKYDILSENRELKEKLNIINDINKIELNKIKKENNELISFVKNPILNFIFKKFYKKEWKD